MKKGKSWIITVLLIIFSAVFVVSAVCLISYFSKSAKAEKEYTDLSAIISAGRQDRTDIPRLPSEQTAVVPETGSAESVPEETRAPVSTLVSVDGVLMQPEYVELYTVNTDLVGWITIPGTDIDYPVVQTPDEPNYYLKRSFYKQYSDYGAIYVKEACDVTAPSDNVTIYGHRMNDGSMFAQLHKYKEQSFFEQNRYIFFDTLQEYHTYEIIAVFLISSSESTPFQYQNFIDATDEAAFSEFVENCRQYALYDTGVDAVYGDKLITLSTCEYSNENGRLVVVAKRVL